MVKWIGLVVAGLVLFVVVLLAGALGLVQTSWGERVLLERLLPVVNGQIAGSIGISDLDLSWDHLTLKDIVLRDESGDVVAHVHRISIELAPTALVRGTLRVERLTIADPFVSLRRTDAGLNLTRALAPRRPRPAPDEPFRLPIALRVDQIDVWSGQVHYRSDLPPGPATVSIEKLSAIGSIAVDRKSGRLELRVDGQVVEPLAAPLAFRANAVREGKLEGRARAEVGGSVFATSLRASGPDHFSVDVRQLRIEPRLLRALGVMRPPAATIAADAHLERSGAVFIGAAELAAGTGRLAIDGRYDHSIPALRVAARVVDLDPSILREGAPKGTVDLSAEVQGAGDSWRELRGDARLRMPRVELGGYDIGPIRLTAKAERAGPRSLDFYARLPGVRASAAASGDASETRLQGAIRVTSLERLAAASASLLGVSVPDMAGRGRFDLTLKGGTERPFTLAADARLRGVAIEGVAARRLALSFSSRNTDGPFLGTLSGWSSVQELAIGGQRIAHASMFVKSGPEDVRARLRVGAPISAELVFRGQPADDERLMVTRFRLRYPDTTWRLTDSAILTVGRKVVSLAGFTLRSGQQRMTWSFNANVDPEQAGAFGPIDGRVTLADFQLRSIPRAVLPKNVPLAGLVNGSLRVAGIPEQPTATLDLQLTQARVGEYSGLGAEVEARVQKHQISGVLAATSRPLDARGRLRFEFPLAFPPPAGAPIEASGRFHLGALGALGALLGSVDGKVSLDGTAAHPRLAVIVEAERLGLKSSAPLPDLAAELVFTYRDGDARASLLTQSSHGGRLAATARARLALSLTDLDQAALRSAEIGGSMVVREFDLSPLAALSEQIAATGGRLSGSARIAGRLDDPKLDGSLSWRRGRIIVLEPEARPQ